MMSQSSLGASAKPTGCSQAEPVVSALRASPPRADSGNLPGYYGILNKQGEFWTHTVHGSRREAQNYIKAFWGQQTDMAEACLRDFQIIEVRVRLEPRQGPQIERVSL
jgi:hypothetical protein